MGPFGADRARVQCLPRRTRATHHPCRQECQALLGALLELREARVADQLPSQHAAYWVISMRLTGFDWFNWLPLAPTGSQWLQLPTGTALAHGNADANGGRTAALKLGRPGELNSLTCLARQRAPTLRYLCGLGAQACNRGRASLVFGGSFGLRFLGRGDHWSEREGVVGMHP